MNLKGTERSKLIPLPIVIVSTVSKNGIENLAPYGCVMPVLRPLDLVCIASAEKRDTFRNIEETEEFVLNIPGMDIADEVIKTAKRLSHDESEFDLVNLTRKPSKVVKPSGIKECYAWMECKLQEIITGEEKMPYHLIVGRVVNLEVRDDVYNNGALNLEAARPMMMLETSNGIHLCQVKDAGKFKTFSELF